MKSIEAIRMKCRWLGVAVCGMSVFFTASSFSQQGDGKPLGDVHLSTLLATFDASKLTGEARRTFDVLTLIVEDTDNASAVDKRNSFLQEFLIKSQGFVRQQPNSLQVWTLRAIAALELNQSIAGREACRRMIELKAGDLDDPNTRRVLAILDRKGWIDAEPAADLAPPQTRPILEKAETRPAVFKDNQFGTSNIGPVAYNPKWSRYGSYLHNMMETIQKEWERTLTNGKVKPPPTGYVKIRFSMNWKGDITEILDVECTSSEQGRQSCITAITMAGPYGRWTDNMMANLGGSQELTFMFSFE